MRAVSILLALVSAAAAAETCAVNVRIDNSGAAPPSALYQAKSTATAMFASIGIAILWQATETPACSRSIEILLDAGLPPGDNPEIMAYAMPYLHGGTAIHVFIGRVASMVPPARVGTLLGHVLVHEITHLLQGISRHSDQGVMKPHWSPADFRAMNSGPLPFAPVDVQLLRSTFAATADLAGTND